jgi:hypothetical protein
MPRRPVRHSPQGPRPARASDVSRLQRLQARAPEVAPPLSFWAAEEPSAAEEQVDDPAEIPGHGPLLVSEASQSAAGGDAAEFAETGRVLHW